MTISHNTIVCLRLKDRTKNPSALCSTWLGSSFILISCPLLYVLDASHRQHVEYDVTIFWFLEARKSIMNDSSSRGPLNARIRGALSLASFLGTGVASPSVRFPSYINTTSLVSFHHFNLADFSRENPSPLLPI